MQAPAIGGVRVRKGNGELVRLTRGSSLADFADKAGQFAMSMKDRVPQPLMRVAMKVLQPPGR